MADFLHYMLQVNIWIYISATAVYILKLLEKKENISYECKLTGI